MQIHRCLFVPHQPASIHHVAATAPYYPNPLVAVAKSDNTIDIWNTTSKPSSSSITVFASIETQSDGKEKNSCQNNEEPPAWHCMGSLPPIEHQGTIEAIAWAMDLQTNNDELINCSDSEEEGDPKNWRKSASPWLRMRPRLFSGSMNGILAEYDVDQITCIQQTDSFGGGAIWALCVSPCQKYLLAGCEDGCIRVYDIDGPPGYICYLRCFDKQKGRIMCLKMDEQEPLCLFSGSGDGIIRKWDFKTGQVVQKMGVSRSTMSSEDNVIVWDLTRLSGNMLASCDSTGCVKIWDCHTCTLLKTFKSHDVDVLALGCNLNGKSFFAGGLDGKIAIFNLTESVSDAFVAKPKESWTMVQQRRLHTHDVRTLTWLEFVNLSPKAIYRCLNNCKRSYEKDGNRFTDIARLLMQECHQSKPEFDHLVSGGLDMQLTFLPNPSFRFLRSQTQPVRLSPFPNNPVTQVSKERRLLLAHNDGNLMIWRLGQSEEMEDDACTSNYTKGHQTTSTVLPIKSSPEFLLNLRIASGRRIISSSIDESGEWIAACDDQRAFLYHISWDQNNSLVNVKDMSRLIQNFYKNSPCRFLRFTFAGTLSLVCKDNLVVLVNLPSTEDIVVASKSQLSFSRLCRDRFEAENNISIPVQIACDKKGRFLTVLDSLNHVNVYDIRKRCWMYQLPTISDGLPGSLNVVSLVEHNFFYDVIAIPFMMAPSAHSRDVSWTQIRLWSIQKRRFITYLEADLGLVRWLSGRHGRIQKIDVVYETNNLNGNEPSKDDKRNMIQYMLLSTSHWLGRIDLRRLRRAAKDLKESLPKDEEANFSDVEKDQRGLHQRLMKRIQDTMSVTHRFQNVLAFEVLERKHNIEAVIVERPWSLLWQNMPAPIDTKSFGQ